MRTVTCGAAVSLDGFLAGANGAIDWLHFSSDVQDVMKDYWKDVDTILMGRKTYEVAVAQRSAAKKIQRRPRDVPSQSYVPISFRTRCEPSTTPAEN
jgi:dihydrofolate reductase